ncbi:MAG: hypothetical protein ACREV6_02870 [Clostridium sp.]|uniref:hypothetical protein n=1 Tax=Clostridium sp. TaxID=1506 RepID=UPI003D6C77C0
MRNIKKNKFWADFISLFVTSIISTGVSDYFELKGGIFSLGFVLRFGIFMITFTIMQFLISKIIYVWNKNKNNK